MPAAEIHWQGQKGKGKWKSLSGMWLWPHALPPTRPLCPWGSPGKNTGVGSHSLLQGTFLTQGQNSHLLYCRQILYPLSHQGSPIYPCCYEFSKNHGNQYFPSITNLNIHIIVLLFCNIFSRPMNFFWVQAFVVCLSTVYILQNSQWDQVKYFKIRSLKPYVQLKIVHSIIFLSHFSI